MSAKTAKSGKKKPSIEQRRAELIECHMLYATKLARAFYHRRKNVGIDYEDFLGAAMLGLCDAAYKFNPDLSPKFKTYSYLRIRGAMYDLLRSCGGISRNSFNEIVGSDLTSKTPKKQEPKKTMAIANDVMALTRMTDIFEEVGMKLHVDIRNKKVQLSYSQASGPEEVSCSSSLQRYLGAAMQQIPERERNVLKSHYFEDQPFSEIVDRFDGVSRSWISRLHINALESMKGQFFDRGQTSYQQIVSH